jgi:hypothetical protein
VKTSKRADIGVVQTRQIPCLVSAGVFRPDL